MSRTLALAEFIAQLRTLPIVSSSISSPRECDICHASTFTLLHFEGYFTAIVPFCQKHREAVESVLRDPNNWPPIAV